MVLPQSGDSPRVRTVPSRRVWLALLAAGGVVLIAVLVAVLAGGGKPRLPLPGIGRPARSGDPFAYVPAHQAGFVARATTGTSQVVFIKSPGGVMATATRVAHFRKLIDAAAAGSGVDPNILEGIVFLESAGRPNVIAGTDPADASGLTQILAQTGRSLLGMHINLARSRRLTAEMVTAANRGRGTTVVRLEHQRARVDDRFDPAKALAATVRYLKQAERQFGRLDLAVVSYHMGIGNLQQVLDDYDGGHPVPYAQLFFDVSPAHHASAYELLTSFGDDSSLYYWRVLAAAQIMHMYRTDRGALNRLANLESDTDSDADVLHPPGQTPEFANQSALYSAYSHRILLPLPRNPSSLGLGYSRGLGSLARHLGAPRELYRGLRPAALDLLVELAARVRELSGGAAPLIVSSAVLDKSYDDAIGGGPDGATAGYEFSIARHYVSRAQAVAFQSMLDRLQALNLIAWIRTPQTIEITVASDASHVIVNGP
jgi:Transglycosylase SLT domain